jgi:hypothetical protein
MFCIVGDKLFSFGEGVRIVALTLLFVVSSCCNIIESGSAYRANAPPSDDDSEDLFS